MPNYHVFLSHNSKDKPVVEQIARLLRDEYKLNVWLDKWMLTPGKPWMEELELGLDESLTVAIFLGVAGLSKWENEEMRVAIDAHVSDPSKRVIPVLLPDAPDNPQMSVFLKRYTWVDLRSGYKSKRSLHRLYCGIMGQEPGDIEKRSRRLNKPIQMKTGKRTVLLLIRGDVNDFNVSRRDALISAIAAICQIPKDEVELESIHAGSVIAKILLPEEATHYIINLATKCDERLVSLGIRKIKVEDDNRKEISLVDQIPEPHPLRVIDRISFGHNPNFTGRKDDLRALARAIIFDPQPEALAITQAIAGMGGIGKTQLAVEFCYRYGAFFKGIHWMDARQVLDAEIAACGAKMELADWPETTPEQVRVTLNAWQTDPKRLLVLDNINDPQMLRKWKHEFEGMSVLMTSRDQTWDTDLATVHTLNILARDEGIALLSKLAPRLKYLSKDDVDLVASRLGYLPLALDLAGRYLRIHPIKPQQYLEKLQKTALKHKSLTNVEITFLVSWEQLGNSDVDKLAKTFSIASGYLASDVPIPREVFYSFTSSENSVDLDSAELADDAILRLNRLGLLTEALASHPLLAEFARTREGDNTILTELTQKMEKLSDQYLETGLPTKFMPLLPHVETLASFAEREGVIEAGELLHKLGTYYGIMGKYQEAYLTFERGFSFLEKSSTETPNRAEGLVSFMANMGEMLRNRGDFLGAKAKYEIALELGKKMLGEEHGFIIYIMNNLGLVLRQMGNLQEARSMHESVLEIGERVYGKENQNVAIWLNNLGADLHNMGDYSGAKALYERALKIHEIAYSENHPSVAIDINNLGVLVKDMGDYLAAKALHERALAIQVEIFGEKHPDIALSLHNLAVVFLKLDEFSRALDYEERALSMWEEYLPPEHPDIKKARKTLAEIDEKLKR